MPTFDTSKMSADEFKFIRTYCGAVRRDYEKIDTVLALTSRSELAVSCPFAATKMAQELHAMQDDFCAKLVELGARFSGKEVDKLLLPTTPSFDEIGRIFALSFFKIVDSDTKAVVLLGSTDTHHDGWSSGRPSDWQHTLKSLYDIQKQSASTDFTAGMIFSKLFKLFKSLKTPQSLPDPYEEEEYYDEDDDEYYDQFFS